MKTYLIAASALLLGSSGYALAAADTDSDAAASAKLAADAAYAGWDKSAAQDKLTDASFAAWDEPALKAEKLALADASDPVVQSKLALASAAASAAKAQAGMGGPDEPLATAATTELTPRPATQNYPPCDPGPGDDRCIQLYEPGVRAQLASWNEPTGGLLDHSATTAMGGPYEPVEDDAALAATADAESDTQLAHHSAAAAVGGPVEARSGYPPCAPGPGDDRCIQLYEPGVTGAGN